MELTERDAVRFWSKVDRVEGGCWEWRGSILTSGYGQFWCQGGPHKAHRIAWVLENGKIPDSDDKGYYGLHVCHHCDNPSCVNPAHLFVGTHADNMRDMAVKGRAKGIPRTPRKLSDDDAIAIRNDARPLAEIAAQYGVSTPMVSMIRIGKRRQFIGR